MCKKHFRRCVATSDTGKKCNYELQRYRQKTMRTCAKHWSKTNIARTNEYEKMLCLSQTTLSSQVIPRYSHFMTTVLKHCHENRTISYSNELQHLLESSQYKRRHWQSKNTECHRVYRFTYWHTRWEKPVLINTTLQATRIIQVESTNILETKFYRNRIY